MMAGACERGGGMDRSQRKIVVASKRKRECLDGLGRLLRNIPTPVVVTGAARRTNSRAHSSSLSHCAD